MAHSSDVFLEGMRGVMPTIFLKLQESWSKCWPFCKRVGYNVSMTFFLVLFSNWSNG